MYLSPIRSHARPADRSLRVILVEDRDGPALVHSELQKNSVDVFRVASLEDLAAALEKTNVDAVILDLHEPPGHILSVLQQVRGEYPDLTLIVLEDLRVGTEQVEALGRNVLFLEREMYDGKSLRSAILGAMSLDRRPSWLEGEHLRLQYEAHHDPLTNLRNRRGLERGMASLFSKRAATDQEAVSSIAIVDCDDFKAINGKYGHAVGDMALARVASTLSYLVRSSDLVARVGGDEFLIVLPGAHLDEAHGVAERMRRSVEQQRISHQGAEIQLTVSIGVVEIAGYPASIESCLRSTRQVLETSKLKGKNRVVCEGLATSRSRPSSKDAQLALGLASGRWLTTLFQPIVSLASEEPFGLEALTRGPRGPLFPPSEVFRLAREHGLQAEVDMAALRSALRTYKGGTNEALFLNVFPSTVRRYATSELLEMIEPRARGDRIYIELSEQEDLRDPAAIARALDPLKDVGVGIALDDVGASCCSIHSLAVLEPDIVKVDRRLVAGIGEDGEQRAILLRIVKIAHALGAEVVAEGIESQEDARAALDLGVEYGQGFLWGKPELWPGARSWPAGGEVVPQKRAV